MHTLVDDGHSGVVLQVEQVPLVLGHCSHTSTEVCSLEVRHDL
jgi:hypothetical protein